MVAQFHLSKYPILLLILLILPFLHSSEEVSEDPLPTFDQYVLQFNKKYDNAEYS